MPRVNERCIEHTPDEYRLNGVEIPSGGEVLGTAQDLNGAKVHVFWVHVDKPNCVVTLDHLSRRGDVLLEEVGPFPLKASQWTRFQMGTYRQDLMLPVMLLRVRIKNPTDGIVVVSAYGMSQLQ